MREQLKPEREVTPSEAKKIEIAQPEIEGKKPPRKEAEGKPQEWLDLKREQAYDCVLTEIRAVAERGTLAGEYLYKIIEFGMTRPDYRQKYKKLLTKQDFEKIRFLEATSESASRVADKKITRAVFLVEDPVVYQKIQKVFWDRSGKSHGVVIPGTAFSEIPYWRETGVILSRDNSSIIGHEVRHTIDPNTDKRAGYDRIIEELFAYYQQHIVEGHENWTALEQLVGDDIYCEEYSLKSSKKIPKEQWRQDIKKVIEKVKTLREKYGDIELQRKIIKTQTIDQLLAQE